MPRNRCRFLALSATIGNPGTLLHWLQQVKELQRQQDLHDGFVLPEAAYAVSLILHSERFNDLQHHIYVPSYALDEPLPPLELMEGDKAQLLQYKQRIQDAASLSCKAAVQPVQRVSSSTARPPVPDGEGLLGRIFRFHPLCCVDLNSVASEASFPGSIPSFSAAEALQLYDALLHAWSTRAIVAAEEPADGLAALDLSSGQQPPSPSLLTSLAPDEFFSCSADALFVKRPRGVGRRPHRPRVALVWGRRRLEAGRGPGAISPRGRRGGCHADAEAGAACDWGVQRDGRPHAAPARPQEGRYAARHLLQLFYVSRKPAARACM